MALNSLVLTLVFLGIFACCHAQQNTDSSKADESPWLGTTAKVVGGVVVGAGAVLAAPAVIGAAGFTTAGVAAGSFAAFLQSYVYGGAATGAFAVLQSAGAAGLAVSTKAIIGSVAGGIGATVAGYFTSNSTN